MRKFALLLIVALCALSGRAEKTKLMFSFDTEDFTNPRSADAILRVVPNRPVN